MTVKSQNGLGETALHLAVQFSNLEAARLLLKSGVEVNSRRKDGIAPIHLATQPKILSLLIEFKANVMSINPHGATPLHISARDGNVELGKLLVAAGADVDILDSYGETPLTVAMGRQNAAFVELLLSHNADPNIRNKHGNVPISWLATKEFATQLRLLDVLLQAGADAEVLKCVSADWRNIDKLVARVNESLQKKRPGYERKVRRRVRFEGSVGSQDEDLYQ
jgi:ankyrin repeat protein